MTTSVTNFIIIDDDSCHNIICTLSLKKAFKASNISVTGFTDAWAGIRHIEERADGTTTKTILLLDVNMPGVSGWDVLSKIETLPTQVKDNLYIYMLSSYVTEHGKTKAFSFPCVKGYIQKPISHHIVSISEEMANN